MEGNKKEPLSLRATGAFTVSGVEIHQEYDSLKEWIGVTIRYATTIVATVPILCVYPFIQKYFTKGVMIGAVKE